MKEFNKKQRAYLDKLVKESPTRMILTQNLYDRWSSIKMETDMAFLGQVWETQWSDIDRYVSDKFIEVHGAKMSSNEYY